MQGTGCRVQGASDNLFFKLHSVLPGLAALSASRSAASDPGFLQCQGIHWGRRVVPFSWISEAACTMTWVIRCPGSLLEFRTACSTDMLSHKIVAGVGGIGVDLWFWWASSYTKLMAWNVPINPATSIDH